MRPDDDFSMDWEVDAEVEEAALRHRRGGEARRPRDPRHRPRPRGRGDLLARPAGAARTRRCCATSRSSASSSTPSPSRRCRRRCASRARSTSRWSTPISPAARSTISSASRSRRCSGASCPAPARPAACSRSRCGSSATAKPRSSASARRNTGRSSRRCATPRNEAFTARLVGIDGRKLDRLADRQCAATRTPRSAGWRARSSPSRRVESKPQRRNPQPPFTTSTLQQEAQRKLGFDASRTMQIAQRLYEGVDIGGEPVGLITYMRTDGVDIAPEALSAARRVIEREYGARYLPEAPRRYHAKAKNAQEAHEAIRPTDLSRLPADVARFLDRDQARLYELIWKRTIASQMASAELERTTIDIAREKRRRARRRCAPPARVIRFDGFLTLYQEGRDDEEDEEGGRLPAMTARRAAGAREDRRDPAFHRAAAALHRSLAHQEDGGARHRPALDLCADHGGAAQARLCPPRQEAAGAGGQGPPRHHLPGRLLPPLRGIRFHRRPGGEARPHLRRRALLEGRAARFLAGFRRRPSSRRARSAAPRCWTR